MVSRDIVREAGEKAAGAAIDKAAWGPGPWQMEPDRVEFEAHGFPCLIVRVESHGALCGYVAVPPGHPWHGKGYDDVPADAHGGLTYSEACSGRICHVPKPGEPDNVWWLGFDHAHSGDHCPAHARFGSSFRLSDFETYKTIDYARAGCESLAAQARKAAPKIKPGLKVKSGLASGGIDVGQNHSCQVRK